MDIFGNTDPRKMPQHLFWGALHLDYASAIRGTPERQNFSVCPRHWFIDADFKCAQCGNEFTWTALEQKAWFEDYYFWIDSQPRHCKVCARKRRYLKSLRKEYDSTVSEALPCSNYELKQRIIQIVRELESSITNLPVKMLETKELFQRQLQKRAEQADAGNRRSAGA